MTDYKNLIKFQKYTKGPWNAVLISEKLAMNEIGQGQVSGPKGVICNTEESTVEETMANANLIATAPEMLEALEQALRLIAVAENNNAFKDCALPLIGQKTISNIESIIKKAKGE